MSDEHDDKNKQNSQSEDIGQEPIDTDIKQYEEFFSSQPLSPGNVINLHGDDDDNLLSQFSDDAEEFGEIDESLFDDDAESFVSATPLPNEVIVDNDIQSQDDVLDQSSSDVEAVSAPVTNLDDESESATDDELHDYSTYIDEPVDTDKVEVAMDTQKQVDTSDDGTFEESIQNDLDDDDMDSIHNGFTEDEEEDFGENEPNDTEGEDEEEGEHEDEELFSEESIDDDFAAKKKKILIFTAAGVVALIGIFVVIWNVVMAPAMPAEVRRVSAQNQQQPDEQSTSSVQVSSNVEAEPPLNTVTDISTNQSNTTTELTPTPPSASTVAAAQPTIKLKEPTVATTKEQLNTPSFMAPDQKEAAALAAKASSTYGNNSPISYEAFNDLQRQTAEMQSKLASLSSTISGQEDSISTLRNNNNQAFSRLMSQLSTIQESVAAMSLKMEEKSRTPESLTQGRIRLGQFNVINVDTSGVATAHSPSGRRISLTEGEVVLVGPEKFRVERIFPDQDVVHIGKRWFIDIRREDIGAEERSLRRESRENNIELPSNDFVAVTDGPGQLSYSSAYEIRANVGNRVLLHNCATKNENIYEISDQIPGHGRIRSIRAQEVVTDRSVFQYDTCLSSGG